MGRIRKKQTASGDPAGRREQRDDLVFKAMANADRRRILDLLRQKPLTTGELCEAIDWLDRCTVMQHLKSLEKAELVIAKKRGRQRWNYLNVEPVQRIYNRWIRDYAQPAADFLTRLKDQLEE